ncbi:hypothetical protein ACC722_39210, partial [Rhizobium ruizarguesonis]
MRSDPFEVLPADRQNAGYAQRLVDNGIILLKDGSLMAGWYFAGPNSESSTDFERNEVSRQINAI